MLECESGVCLSVGGYVGGCASTMYCMYVGINVSRVLRLIEIMERASTVCYCLCSF